MLNENLNSNIIKENKKNISITSIELLHSEILKQIRPGTQVKAKLNEVIKHVLTRVEHVINDLDLAYPVEPILVGSTAKDTYLIDPDIDVFLMFPVSVSVDKLRAQGLTIGHHVLPEGEERYAEHPYTSGRFEGFETDIVPCYKLDSIEDRMTAVDRTPFHTEFIIKHLRSEQHDEVRLLKQFMKGIGTYGAEIQVQGFSGYLCELLILKYETFTNLLRAAAQWKPELVLRLNTNFEQTDNMITEMDLQNKSDLSKKLQIKFKDEPLIFIDPVDEMRNVASALAKDKFNLFITAANKYLTGPSSTFFLPNEIKPLSIAQLQQQLTKVAKTIIGIEFSTPDIIPDILYGQLRKCQRAVNNLLEGVGFGISFSDYYTTANDQILMLFELNNSELSKFEIHDGPPEGHKNENDFKSKWNISDIAVGKPYLKDKRWHVKIKREYTTPLELLKSKVFELSLGKHITAEINTEINFYQNTELLKEGFEKPLTIFITRKFPWEY